MRKEHLHASIDRQIFGELLNVWKIEQEKALKNGETISKSAVVELILKMGIKEYHKTHSTPKPSAP